MSSSQSSLSIVINERVVEYVEYERKEVDVDEIVRVFATARRRGISPGSGAIKHTPSPIGLSHGIEAADKKNRVSQRPVVVHQTKTSSDASISTQARNDSFIDLPSVSREALLFSSNAHRATTDDRGELASPPTPRIQRLPTPELQSLKEGVFCDCRGCNRVYKSLNDRDHQNRGRQRPSYWS